MANHHVQPTFTAYIDLASLTWQCTYDEKSDLMVRLVEVINEAYDDKLLAATLEDEANLFLFTFRDQQLAAQIARSFDLILDLVINGQKGL